MAQRRQLSIDEQVQVPETPAAPAVDREQAIADGEQIRKEQANLPQREVEQYRQDRSRQMKDSRSGADVPGWFKTKRGNKRTDF